MFEKLLKKNTNNFKYLDDLIHMGNREIILDSDIVLDEYDEEKYVNGIKLEISNIVIDGNGHEIDARKRTEIFECSGENITIKNITIKNGRTTKYGVITNTGELNIYNSTFTKNTSYRRCNVIDNKGSMKIFDCKFIENKSTSAGTIVNSIKGKINIKGCEFHKNRAENAGQY